MKHVNLFFFQKVNLWNFKQQQGNLWIPVEYKHYTPTKQKLAHCLITRGWSIIMLDVEIPLGKIVKSIISAS